MDQTFIKLEAEKKRSVRWYLESGFDRAGRAVIAKCHDCKVPGQGTTLLRKARWRTLWTTERSIKLTGQGRDRFLNRCPVCRAGEAESVSHILFRCLRWVKLRERYLGELIESLPEVHRSGSAAGCQWILGGDPIPPRKRRNLGLAFPKRLPMVRVVTQVGGFLGAIWPARVRKVKKVLPSPPKGRSGSRENRRAAPASRSAPD